MIWVVLGGVRRVRASEARVSTVVQKNGQRAVAGRDSLKGVW